MTSPSRRPPLSDKRKGEIETVLKKAQPQKTPKRGETPKKGKYVVTGPRTVYGASNGETVELLLTEDQKRHLIQAGHIAPAVEGD